MGIALYGIFLVLLFIAVTLNSIYRRIERYIDGNSEAQTKRELEILSELQQVRRQLESTKTHNY